jgi:hypothetical protein
MKKNIFKTTVLSSFLLGILSIALMPTMQSCKKDEVAAATLYDSLGGTTMVSDPTHPGTMIEKGRLGIRSVVDSTIFVIAGDTAINDQFTVLLAEVTSGNTSGLTTLSKNLTDFFCVATGAKNFTYGGKDMVAAHDPAQNPRMGSKADSHDFDVFVADLVKGAQQVGLPNDLIGRVGRVVNTTRSQVVQR